MRFRLVILCAALSALAVACGFSQASFTTASQTSIVASVDGGGPSGWLNLYSQASDPGHSVGYAVRRNSSPSVPAAAGVSESLVVDLGECHKANTTTTFNRVFTLQTPATFPDALVSAVTVSLTPIGDPSGEPVLSLANLVRTTGGSTATVLTLGPSSVKWQLNVRIRTKNSYAVGRTFSPRVMLTITYAGGPADYFVYDIALPFVVSST